MTKLILGNRNVLCSWQSQWRAKQIMAAVARVWLHLLGKGPLSENGCIC